MGPHVGRLARSSLPSSGSPTLQSRGQNQKWAHMWADWLHQPATWGVPGASKRRGRSDVDRHVGGMAISPLHERSPTRHSGTKSQKAAHMWADSLEHPYCLGGSPGLESGGRNQKWTHTSVDGLHQPCHLSGCQCVHMGDKIRSGPTCGWVGYITLAVEGVPKASKRGTNQKWTHSLMDWLHHPCQLRHQQRLRAVNKIGS